MTILVCGEALFDCFVDNDGIDPMPMVRFDARAGGSPFNVAIGIARLGGNAALLGGISNDLLGARLMNILAAERVATDYVMRSDRQTTLSLVGVDGSGQPAYSFYGAESADRFVTADTLPDIDADIVGFHFGSYSLVVSPVADTFASLAATTGDRFVSVDPNVRPTIEPDLTKWRARISEYVRVADVVKISTEDFQILYPDAKVEAKAAQWIDSGVSLVVVTAGAAAVRAWTRTGRQVQRQPPLTTVADTVGAGDSFQAAMLAKLSETGDPKLALASLDDRALEDLIDFSMLAAAKTCSRRGADLPRRDELEDRKFDNGN